MNTIWSRFIAWMKSKNITTNTVGASLVAFAFAYNFSPELQKQVATLFVGHPVVITKIGIITSDIVILVGLWAKYSHSSSAAGTVARSRAILANGNAPTAAQVDAADTAIK